MITINNLGFYYKKEKPIVKSISTQLQSGKIYGLLGLNGEGKTTLLKLLAGLIFPKTGGITIDNKYSSTERSKEYFEQLYMVPDHPTNSALNIPDFIKIYSIFYRDFSHQLFDEALIAFNIQPNSKIKSLSFGQQKKFHLAFALATNTKLLLLDEPTNGLDIPSKAIFRKLLAKVIDDDKIIIISTHLVHDIENLIDHVLIIKEGLLVLDSNINAILQLYSFGYTSILTDDILYSEKSIANYKTIRQRRDTIETAVDIELLFNAIQHDKL